MDRKFTKKCFQKGPTLLIILTVLTGGARSDLLFCFLLFCHFVFIDKVPRVCKNDNNSIFYQ